MDGSIDSCISVNYISIVVLLVYCMIPVAFR